MPREQLPDKTTLWQNLEAEASSAEFFQLLNRLAESYQGRSIIPTCRRVSGRCSRRPVRPPSCVENCSTWPVLRRVKIAPRCPSAIWKSV
ncbi:hypothetical protein THH46_03425 [Pseudomonas sp. NA13]